MCESTGESAKRADLGRKRIIACEQSTIRYEQAYKLLKSNLSSLTVGFDRIDATIIKIIDSILKENRSTHMSQDHENTL